MKWKTWILAVVAMAGACALVDMAFTYFIIFGTPLSDSARIRHLYEDNSDDMPIFGTSKAHENYCPSDMGVHAYNYGMDGSSFEVTDVFLQIELAKSRTTPIIIELQHADTHALGIESTFVPFVSDPRFRQLLGRFHKLRRRFYIPGMRYFGYYDTYLHDFLFERAGVERVNQGFSEWRRPPTIDQARLDSFIKERLRTKTGYFPDEDQTRRLLAHINGHPQRLFFLVISPYHPSYFAHFENAEKFAEFEEKLAALPNVVLIDWGKLYDSDKVFGDSVHMRREAAVSFSRSLGDRIRDVLRERAAKAKPGKNQSSGS